MTVEWKPCKSVMDLLHFIYKYIYIFLPCTVSPIVSPCLDLFRLVHTHNHVNDNAALSIVLPTCNSYILRWSNQQFHSLSIKAWVTWLKLQWQNLYIISMLACATGGSNLKKKDHYFHWHWKRGFVCVCVGGGGGGGEWERPYKLECISAALWRRHLLFQIVSHPSAASCPHSAPAHPPRRLQPQALMTLGSAFSSVSWGRGTKRATRCWLRVLTASRAKKRWKSLWRLMMVSNGDWWWWATSLTSVWLWYMYVCTVSDGAPWIFYIKICWD